MKYLKSINERFLRKFFNEDEETAEGILNSLNDSIRVTIIEGHPNGYGDCEYTFRVDGFDILVKRHSGFRHSYRSLKIDGTDIVASDNVIDKIIKKCYLISHKEQLDQKEYTKRDAKLHFKNNPKK